MAVQLINVGAVANDGTGDDLREAMIKINQNFEELDLRDDEQTTASNIGAVGEGVFAQKINYDLQFKKLVGGSDITLTATDNQITIDADGGLKSVLVVSDSGSTTLTGTSSIEIFGGTGISTSLVGDRLTINNTSSDIVTDTTPELGGNLNANNFNISNVGTITATEFVGGFTGNLTGLVYGVDVRDIDQYFESFDLGSFTTNYTSAIEYIIANVDVDLGTVGAPNPNSFDFGGF